MHFQILKIISSDLVLLISLHVTLLSSSFIILGVEIEENSELDLLKHLISMREMKEFPEVVKSMEKELGTGNKKPEILPKLAQYELTLLDWVEQHKGSRKFVAIAGKCWYRHSRHSLVSSHVM